VVDNCLETIFLREYAAVTPAAILCFGCDAWNDARHHVPAIARQRDLPEARVVKLHHPARRRIAWADLVMDNDREITRQLQEIGLL
jgi:hypothetical protein